MFFKDVGYLCKEIQTLDKLKRPRISYKEEKVLCNIKSIGYTEFYQAQSVGLRPEIKVQLRLVDLDDVTHFKYQDKLYKVIRFYKKEDISEIILTSMVIDNE